LYLLYIIFVKAFPIHSYSFIYCPNIRLFKFYSGWWLGIIPTKFGSGNIGNRLFGGLLWILGNNTKAGGNKFFEIKISAEAYEIFMELGSY
jgi:hypothetical protein